MMRVNARAVNIPDEVRFSAFVAQKAGVVARREHEETFGKLLLESHIDGYRVRLIRDRGGIVVEIGDEHRWHSVRNLLGLYDGEDPTVLSKKPEPAVEVALNRWNDLVRVISTPALATYEHMIGQAVMKRLKDEWMPSASPTMLGARG